MIGPLYARAEKLLNRQIGESTSARRMLAQLTGRSFRICVDGLALDAVLAAEPGRLTIAAADDRPTDVVVRGTPFDLLRLLGPDMASRVHGSGVEITGRMHVAEQFAELLRLAMPDLEEELSGWIGDVAAHQLGRAARGASEWAAKAVQALRLDVSDFLTEESQTLPTRYEVDALLASVEKLRDDVERAEARLDRLERARRAGRPDSADAS